MQQPWHNSTVIAQTQILLSSFHHWFGRPLVEGSTPEDAAQVLFEAPFAVLSHGGEPDPILNYGNRTALALWEMGWAEFTAMPSRLTAEPDLRSERATLLEQAKVQGYLTDYEGVRISKTGRRFLIRKATIWRLLDSEGQFCGQAALFDRWESLS